MSMEPARPSSFTRVDKRALAAVAAQFFINGALFASFVPRLPEIRDQVGITIASVGLLLSLAGAASLFGSFLAPRTIERFGTRAVMLGAGTIVSASLAAIGTATTAPVLLAGLVGMMTFDVLVDVAMNMQGSWLSARRSRPVMNRLHGLWSLGTVMGGLLSVRLATSGVSLRTHLVAAAVVLLGAAVVVSLAVLRNDEHVHEVEPDARTRRRLSPALVAFFLAGMFALAMEATAADWAAFRMTDDLAAGPGLAAFAFVSVTAGMTLGRFAGDWLAQRTGPDRLMVAATGTSGIGLALATSATGQSLSLLGFTLSGLGIATLLPKLYDDAAQWPGRPGAGLGALTAGLRTASLLAPFAVGSLAATDLSVGAAIAIVTLPSVVGFLITTRRLAAMRLAASAGAGPVSARRRRP